MIRPGPVEQLEWKTFDWRVQLARHFNKPVSTNLGFVYISDASIAAVNSGRFGLRYGLYWPRHLYGRVVRELAAGGAAGIAIDILFADPRPDHAPVQVDPAVEPGLEQWLTALHKGEPPLKVDGRLIVESDDYFAWQLHRASNAILAAESMLPPHELFATNALCLGDISTEPDSDGILRRVKAFKEYIWWHPLFKLAEADPSYGIDLRRAQVEPDKIVLPRDELPPIVIPLDADGNFELADFVGQNIPPGWPRKAKPFTTQRVWQIGIALAAHAMKLDLATAEIDRRNGQIRLAGPGGIQRSIPIDSDACFYINWALQPTDSSLTKVPIEEVLRQHFMGPAGAASDSEASWDKKLVIIGSVATGSDLTDRGPTPLEKDALLVGAHLNVANSILTGQFIRRTGLGTELIALCALGLCTALGSWRLRVGWASTSAVLLMCLYIGLSSLVYVRHRVWLPVIVPVLGGVLLEHVGLVTYRVVFAERERRRIKTIFARVVSPEVVQELLSSETLSLGGAQREVTVMFADLREFTELTDTARIEAERLVRDLGLTGRAAEACFEERARDTLATVNMYLSVAADVVKKHNGTLDKYIGDCVMAFWGAPTADPAHALQAVQAAIALQRAVEALNRDRLAENSRRQQQNSSRAQRGEAPLPLLPVLSLGIGINTGVATVGLMGSVAHILNYTVFGREVNLASRLENLSAGGQILIGEATFRQIAKTDPDLAAKCVPMPPTTLKGFRDPVAFYKLLWS